MAKGVATTVVVLAALGLRAAPVWGITPAQVCEVAKLKTAGKYGFCRLKAQAKSLKTGSPPDFTKCEDTFADKWGLAEMHAAGACPSTGDQVAFRDFVVHHTGDVSAALDGFPLADCPGDLASCDVDLSMCNASLLSCLTQPTGRRIQTGQTICYDINGDVVACAGTGVDGELQKGLVRSYLDNGDGTITDFNTGLMWEKLSDDGSVHDRDDAYNWAGAVTIKIAALNSGNFAGHNDWRLPNVNELQSLVSYGAVNPAIAAVFYQSCPPGSTVLTGSCNQSLLYWTSTTYRDDTAFAWIVDMSLGIVTSSGKYFNEYVRAVRDLP